MKKTMNILTLIMFLWAGLASAAEYAVIIHNKNDFSGNLKNFYLLKQGFREWPSGVDVSPFILKPEGDLKKTLVKVGFLKQILGMSVQDFNNHWTSQKSKGNSDKAVPLENFEKILRYVKREEGAIGFVPKNLAKGVNVVGTFEVD